MKKQFIRLNDNDNHLSLGNLFRIIKDMSKNKSSALQGELFCVLFDIESVNETTVNNYCVGCRGIGNDFKQIFLNMDKKYLKKHDVFCDSIIGLLSIIDGTVHASVSDKVRFINESVSAYELVSKLYNLAKNDKDVQESIIVTIKEMINNKMIYEALVECLRFIVLFKKQPISEEGLKKEVLESVLNDTSISSVSLQEYLSLKLREGINYEYQLKNLAESGNAYACFEFGSNEYYGYYKGYSRYDEAYRYLSKAAQLDHAGANYMIGTMYIKGMLGNQTNEDLEFGYKYLIKAYELGNVAACNSIGNMYYDGIYPLEKDENEAVKYFKEACLQNYVYAFNNMGNIYESEKKYEEAFEYFKKSADMGESWACNKVGEYYRLGIIEKNMEKAFYYYNKALDCNFKTLRYYAYYNLAKYFYLNGCTDVVLLKDRDKAKEYLRIASCNDVIDASILLFYLLVEDYLNNRNGDIYEEILSLKIVIEKSINDKEIILSINEELENIVNLGKINIEILN
ncbi:MAG: sel1 repeat family protein [Bacilli bacterium]|nr:sel1 repeat family protein [Bacilli bacterium]